ncbi:receptor-like protein EIX2 [Hibiscus syriacus]|uniref:receptor-like protein EIX2 n=1 Tax=Hibiscus syriacus TaxID=106335 RepID=UPI0019217C2F|nr:receptor-like protein EIX2 [Hibiscus syriacus]
MTLYIFAVARKGYYNAIATMTVLTISSFPFLLLIAAACVSFCHGNSNVLCIGSERDALLKLKNDLIDPSNRLSSWVEGGDCCEWNGVVCHNTTGHVTQLLLSPPEGQQSYGRSSLGGKINPSLLELYHLNWLDLSNNNFSSIQIPEFLGFLGSLTYLNLSQALFLGAIPHNLGNLSELLYLDLRGNYFLEEEKSLQWISGLTSLQYLDLSHVDHHKATDWLQVTLSNLPSLLELHLSGCILEGPIPDYFGNMSFLKVIDLSFNSLNSSIPNSLYSLNHLQSLGFTGSYFQGEISNAIGNLSSLIHLDMSDNQLQGKVSASLGDLCKLKEMNLSYNGIDQDISEILRSLSKCCLDSLESLSMEYTQLSGHLTHKLGQFKNLAYLNLAGNNISGPIPLSIGELSSLKVFDVSENQLNGTLPPNFGKLANLEGLYIGQNQLEGVVSETHFSNLTKLSTLSASRNMLRFEPNSSWIPPFQCEIIKLSYWHLGPKFPHWLKFQKKLSYLDLSHTGIADVMPTWFLNLSSQFQIVNLSSNQLTGEISYLNVEEIVDLSSNRFFGPLPRLLSNRFHERFRSLFYILSRNLFSGSLSEFVCNSSVTSMSVLHIDTNLLSGEIPDCWNGWWSLRILNLENNNLTGRIPSSLGDASLEMLNLRNNSMFGELPSTLQNCTDLVILDLSENHFSGRIPAWIGDKLSNLMVLSLRSNNFVGLIPHQICALQSLQILDLGHNDISGAIPKCLRNLSAMAIKEKQSEHYYGGVLYRKDADRINYLMSASLVLKGREDLYSTTLGLVTSICLSANSFTGHIPKEVGTLIGLLSLNLSRNLLTGNIPDSIGNMKLMESLDLSMNHLHGGIPSSFSNLNFLNHFNVSYNNLTGQIPTATQLQSFENSSFMGNHLCGPPVSKSCSTKGVPTDATKNGDNSGRSKVNGFYVSMVVGFVMGFWGVVAPLFFIRSWRHAYYGKLEHIGNKVYVFWATKCI